MSKTAPKNNDIAAFNAARLAVKAAFGVDPKDISTKRGEYHRARISVYYLLRLYEGMSWSVIGHLFDFDHTSVLVAFRKLDSVPITKLARAESIFVAKYHDYLGKAPTRKIPEIAVTAIPNVPVSPKDKDYVEFAYQVRLALGQNDSEATLDELVADISRLKLLETNLRKVLDVKAP